MREVPRIFPEDDYNKSLLENVHPADWKNPTPTDPYNLVVIGAGTAGLVTAAGAAGLGAKVALIERNLMGGDCLNVGCVPSKCIIRSSRAAYDLQEAGTFGVKGVIPEVDFGAVMERMRRLRARISPNDSVHRFANLGIDVYLGDARFLDGERITVDNKVVKFKRAVIATGARAAHPVVEGLEQGDYLTNETVFSLTERPRRLLVIGGGPLGCEMAQAFSRLGCEVTLLHKHEHILNREDADAAQIVQDAFVDEGVRVVLGCGAQRVERTGGGTVVHFACARGADESIEVDAILVGAGRAPNVENMGLEDAGVEYDEKRGIKVSDRLQTTNSKIYAVGDCCMQFKFTHAADAAARIVIQNALFWGRKKLSALTVPWCTYTDPEIAHVGMYKKDAEASGIDVETFRVPFGDVDRAVTDGEVGGLLKIHVKRGSDKILGATIVARHAGEMISELTTAIVSGVGLGKLAGVIHPYPTQAEAIKHAADAYNRTRLTPMMKKVFTKVLTWMR